MLWREAGNSPRQTWWVNAERHRSLLLGQQRPASTVGGRWSVVGGRWSVVGGRWSVVGGRWSVVGGRKSVDH
ncbi:MAG: hypothetical protein IPK44_04075 [Candidatus Accumulibacter sp.]|uniref:hypothetical protein n=1 Tax=Accumulibacter sp. TaxID=2053492 RepID=UPI00258C2B2A|nr:hypothetical protein [Accumulibacter sp.]MBK8113770.1 hypothetical protein [Accumulibacter sp.]